MATPTETAARLSEAEQERAQLNQPARRTRAQLLANWLLTADNVTLACRDEGHFWDMGAKDTKFGSRLDGAWGARERCHRRVDGVSCQVRRTRYQNRATGYLDGPSAAYDYSFYTPERPYKLPADDNGFSILDKDARAAIRAERVRRGKLGEETS